MAPGEENGSKPGQWSEYRRLVIAQLEALEKNVTSLRDAMVKQANETRETILTHDRKTDEDVARLRERIVIIETKAAALGFAAGLVISIIVALVKKYI